MELNPYNILINYNKLLANYKLFSRFPDFLSDFRTEICVKSDTLSDFKQKILIKADYKPEHRFLVFLLNFVSDSSLMSEINVRLNTLSDFKKKF